MAGWLLKSEPSVFSVEDLARAPRQTTSWEGVRNYQARNFLRAMQRSERGLFYHSSCKEPGVYGVVEVVKTAYADPAQFDPASPYFDPESRREDPRWSTVDVHLVEVLAEPILLSDLKARAARLDGFRLLARGNRLSVLPVDPQHWEVIFDAPARRRAR